MNASQNPLSIWPAAASASAAETDHLILIFTLVILVLTVPVFIAIAYFAFRYRQGKNANRTHQETRSNLIELSWMTIPFLMTLFFYFWGARIFDTHSHPPEGALTITAIGRQWMWKFQHPGGQSEINDLHVPIGQPVLIRMISQDVIHALYIPALRIQYEVLPDRYTELWFNADRPGVYHLFCSEYCGTDHSMMAGEISLMTPADYQDWLSHADAGKPLAAQGKALFASLGCNACHEGHSTARAPSLSGLYQTHVPLEGGTTIIADETYIRNKILSPDLNKIAGYQQLMPSFKGAISEDGLAALIAYLKLKPPAVEIAHDLSNIP